MQKLNIWHLTAVSFDAYGTVATVLMNITARHAQPMSVQP